MNLSTQAQEILDILKDLAEDQRTSSFIEEYDGVNWLSMTNVLNGHVEAPDDYKEKLDILSDKLNGYLITPDGHHSKIYYELRRAGYRLRTGESDSFGPLSAVIVCPYADWSVCYG